MDPYGRCQAIGLLLAVALGVGLSRARGLGGWKVLGCLVGGVAGAIVGGRLAKALGDLPAVLHEPALLFQLAPRGFDLLGAILGAALVAGLLARWASVSVLDLADSVVPGLGLAIAAQRWGCWTAGCCFGRPTSLPWAVSVPPYGEAHGAQMTAGMVDLMSSPLPVHPYPLYELALGLVVAVAGFAVWRRGRRGRRGAAFGVFLAVFFDVKAALIFTRFPDSAGDPPWVHLAFYTLLAVCGIGLIARSRGVPTRESGQSSPERAASP